MSMGLKRSTVRLEEHQGEWESNAAGTIAVLRQILGDTAVDIQHVGSTSIGSIVAKPIIDLVIGVRDLDHMTARNQALEEAGIIYRKQDVAGQLLYVMGDFQEDTRTHHIHVVIHGSDAWSNYLNFRDYLNQDPEMARTYSELKQTLCREYADNRGLYTEGKQALIEKILALASAWRSAQASE